MMDYQLSDGAYKSIFESNLDAILILNSDDKILEANSAAELLFGYSHDEIIKLSKSELINNKDPRLSTLLNELRIEGKVKGEITLLKTSMIINRLKILF
jgi:PAS domain S-box-containing protein